MTVAFLAQINDIPLDPLTQYGAIGVSFFIVIGILKWMQKRLEEKDKMLLELANDHRDKMVDAIKDCQATNAGLLDKIHDVDKNLTKNLTALAVAVETLANRVGHLEIRS